MTYLACATVSSEGFKDSGYTRTFDLVPKAGFRFIEFNLWFGNAVTDGSIESLKSRCEETGMQTAAVYGRGLGIVGPGQQDVDVAHKIHMMHIAERLGCARVVTGGVPGRDAEAFRSAVDVLNLIAPMAEDRGLSICLENHAGFTLESIEDYESLFSDVPSPAVGLCIDTGHFEAAGIRLDDVVDRLWKRTNHIHVKENKGFGVKDFRRFGEGTTDNVGLVQNMVDRGYEGFITVEISPQKDRASNLEDLRTAYKLFDRFDSAE